VAIKALDQPLTSDDYKLLKSRTGLSIQEERLRALETRSLVIILPNRRTRKGLSFRVTPIGLKALQDYQTRLNPPPEKAKGRKPIPKIDRSYFQDFRGATHSIPKQSDTVHCPYPGCEWEGVRRELDRHQKDFHRRQER